MSSCGPHRAVQGSHPHQRGQSVSCVYLIRRWWLFLGLSLHHPPMASPWGLESLSPSSGDVVFFSPMIVACWGYDCPRPYNLEVWNLSICPRAFLTPRRGPWAWYQMGRGPRSFGPTIAPQNPAVWTLGWGGGFWRSRAYIMVDWVLPSHGR